MKRIVFIFSLLFSYLILAQDSPQNIISHSNVKYYKVSKVRIFISDVSEIQDLRKKGVVNERIEYQDGYFDTYIDEYELKILVDSGYTYKIIIPMLQKIISKGQKNREKKSNSLEKKVIIHTEKEVLDMEVWGASIPLMKLWQNWIKCINSIQI